mmetsp:Transcript_95140/g.269317  ORF Transcript_95140/g.269317 Transcript_95140/m.269317 type:complete len:163 (-) Transcript_95140:162-650(-)
MAGRTHLALFRAVVVLGLARAEVVEPMVFRICRYYGDESSECCTTPITSNCCEDEGGIGVNMCFDENTSKFSADALPRRQWFRVAMRNESRDLWEARIAHSKSWYQVNRTTPPTATATTVSTAETTTGTTTGTATGTTATGAATGTTTGSSAGLATTTENIA